MENLYNILLRELPKIAAVVDSFPLEQRDKAMDLLVEALKNGKLPVEVAEQKPAPRVDKKKDAVIEPVILANEPVESETSKKLSKLRAKIFEKNTAASVENNTELDELKTSLDQMTTEELSNVVFYQKGTSTPLSDML